MRVGVINRYILIFSLSWSTVPKAQAEDEAQDTLNGHPVAKDRLFLEKNDKKDGGKVLNSRPRTVLDQAYDFVSASLTRHDVADALLKVHDESQYKLRDEFGYMLPGETVGEISSKENVKDGLNSGLGKASFKELTKAVDFLRMITKKFEFSFDMANMFKGSDSAPEPAKRKRVNGHYGLLPQDENNQGSSAKIGLLSPPKEEPNENYDATPNKKEGYQFGKFNGGITSGIEDKSILGQSSLNDQAVAFSLEQQNGLYVMQIPIAAKSNVKELTQEFNVPLLGEVKAARKIDYKGEALRTSLKNVLSQTHGPQLDMHYLHKEEHYAGELIYKQSPHEFSVHSEIPSKMKMQLQSLGGEGAEYSMGYARPL